MFCKEINPRHLRIFSPANCKWKLTGEITEEFSKKYLMMNCLFRFRKHIRDSTRISCDIIKKPNKLSIISLFLHQILIAVQNSTCSDVLADCNCLCVAGYTWKIAVKRGISPFQNFMFHVRTVNLIFDHAMQVSRSTNRYHIDSNIYIYIYFHQISMTARQTRAKTEQLAKIFWLITTALVLQAIQEKTAL